MAENRSKSFTKINSGVKKPGSASNHPSTKTTNISKASSRDLLTREEEYKRLNEELEAKTATLVREAETVISEQSDVLSRHSLLDNISTDDLYGYEDNEDDDNSYNVNLDVDSSVSTTQASSRAAVKVNNQTKAQPAASRNHSNSRPQSGRTKTKSAAGRGKTKSKSNVAEDVAVPDEAFLSEYKDFSLQKTISHLEDKIDSGHYIEDEEDVLPSAAAEMGSEAQIRFLKAKLRVMQEELDRLAADCNKKEEQSSQLSGRLKEVEEEKSRYQRTSASQQTQIDKYKKLAEDAKAKADSLENQLVGVKKELEAIKRTQKQQSSSHSVTEVRLNRALEEVEKYKSQLNKSKSQSKETVFSEKKRADQLLAENKRLEKQKNELMTGFKKQLKLIDILKRQKMHIEAAKMLSFTEEEFVKALEWGQ